MFNSKRLNKSYSASSNKYMILIASLFVFSNVSSMFGFAYSYFNDPKNSSRTCNVAIDSAKIEVKPHGIYAEVTTEYWYRPTTLTSPYDTLELVSFFELAPGDFMNNSWLWVQDTMVQAMILDVNQASLIYENIVHRIRRDPSILYRRNTGGSYEYRVFPHAGNESRHVKLSYWTKLNFSNGNAVCNFYASIFQDYYNGKPFKIAYKFYLNNNFTDVNSDANINFVAKNKDQFGEYIECRSNFNLQSAKFIYTYDFSNGYFSKSNKIDDQTYYFSIFDSKELPNSYISQKINMLIDFDPNRTSTTSANFIQQIKTSILANLSEKDSINIMIGAKNTKNMFNRWVPCQKDTINSLIDSTFYKNIGIFSYLHDLMVDGITFNQKFNDKSTIILFTSSEYAPTAISANPIIEECMGMMGSNIHKITTIDFSDTHYSAYTFGNKNFKGDQYFNEKIAQMTYGEFYTVKGTNLSVANMLSSSLSSMKSKLSEVGLYIEAKDGLTVAKTTEIINDETTNKKLICEYGKMVGDYPIEAKISALLDNKVVMKKYTFVDSNTVKSSESSKMWNWTYIRSLENKPNRSLKESQDLVYRSQRHRILSIQTAFLCLEPWMMPSPSTTEEEENGNMTSVSSENQEIAIDISYGPNPIQSYSKINLQIQDDNTKILSIGIVDLMGNVLKEFDFDANSKNLELEWNLEAEGQNKIASGTYFLVINSNLGKKVIRLVVL